MPKPREIYSPEFKQEAVKLVKTTGKSCGGTRPWGMDRSLPGRGKTLLTGDGHRCWNRFRTPLCLVGRNPKNIDQDGSFRASFQHRLTSPTVSLS